MHDTKERLSLFWIFALLNYLYADVVALFAIVGSPNLADAPHLPPWALLGSALDGNTHRHDCGVSTTSV
jgi:hypothetical protein